MLGVDPRRFGPYASRGYLKAKNEEAYANVFTSHYPDEERVAARPLKTRALLRPHERARRGVRLGLRLGAAELVRAAGYGLGEAELDKPTTCSSTTTTRRPIAPASGRARAGRFRRSNYFGMSATKCRNVAENVGLQDMSAFAKCFVTGPGAEAWLDSLLANRIPKKVGRIDLCHLLTKRRRRALRVHRLPRAAGGLLPRLRRRAGAPRPRLSPEGAAGRRLRRASTRSRRRGACWCSPARARATCCRSSPTPTSPTRPSPG